MTNTDTTLASHFGQMLGMAQSDAAHGAVIAEEIAVDRRISDALATINAALDDVAHITNALQSLGIPAAKHLGRAINAIDQASGDIRQCQSDLVMLRFDASQQSTTNMMNAVLATVGVLAADEGEN